MISINGIDHHGSTKPYNGKEDMLQITCANYLRMHRKKPMFFHVPNGGKRNMTTVTNKKGISKQIPLEAQRLNAMGVMAGVSDLLILESDINKVGLVLAKKGLFIELKAKGGTLQQSQFEFLLAAQERGFKVAVCWNFEVFKALVDNYLNP